MSDSTTTSELTDEIRARRVAVARDMIEQIRAKKIRVNHAGGYLDWQSNYGLDPCGLEVQGINSAREKVAEIVKAGGDIQPVIDDIIPFCNVCFRGGLMLAKARVFDAVPAALLFNSDGRSRTDDDATADALADTFDLGTLVRLEAAFERSTFWAIDQLGDDADWDAIRGAVMFGKRFSDPESRAIAAAENLIENRGAFIVDGVAEEDFGDDCDDDEDDWDGDEDDDDRDMDDEDDMDDDDNDA